MVRKNASSDTHEIGQPHSILPNLPDRQGSKHLRGEAGVVE